MKKILFLIILFFLFSSFVKAEELALAPSSESAILIEASTGKVLFQKNQNEKLAPASMTKIMTLLLAMEEIEKGKLKLSDKVLISKNASSMGGSQIFIQEGTEVSVEDLIKGIGIASANDASVAIAEKIGGTQENFVNMMNQKAKSLGLKNTNFKNPHGLDEANHYTTASDLVIIAKELIKHEYILKITSTYEEYLTKADGSKFWLVNTNKLVRFYQGMDGLKTGYTEEAGYCLTSTAKKNDMRLISVVMKSDSLENRNSDTIGLLEYGYSMYSTDLALSKTKSLGTANVEKGVNKKIDYYLEEDVKILLDKNTRKVDYDYKINIKKLKAPLNKGDIVGTLEFKTGNETIKYNLIVKQNLKKANFFKQLINNFKDIISGNLQILG